MAARNALEVSFRVTHTVPGQQIRHWPSLDLLISVTYKLEDCLACLRYIEWALKVNTYNSGLELGIRNSGCQSLVNPPLRVLCCKIAIISGCRTVLSKTSAGARHPWHPY